METRGEKDGKDTIVRMLSILRNITAVMKVVPFVYAGMYIACMLVYMFCSEELSAIVDMLLYVSPFNCLLLFGCSYILRFCNWYRLQTCLPLIPQTIVVIDEIYPFGEYGAGVNITVASVIFLLSLINTYFVFIK